ncbi:hypothetical protein [Amycolatopsis nigrescens]|uniref:hypothetical protein n=1 Tax=Amycolatopsis nigrescens TaxID=381445 RepID=UPI00036D5F05|nr:hypothetical protein [Amycolatopsis nigrescens]
MEKVRRERLRELAEYVRIDKPRLFAIYGLFHGDDDMTLCGWGMQWDEEFGGALLYDPGSRRTWQSESAEQLLIRYRLVGDARLVWLDGEKPVAVRPAIG